MYEKIECKYCLSYNIKKMALIMAPNATIASLASEVLAINRLVFTKNIKGLRNALFELLVSAKLPMLWE